MKAKLVPVVGVTFAKGYPDNLLRLAELQRGRRQGDEPLAVILVRNPANEHDANAVEIHVPALGEGAMIGHVSRDNAARLAPLMDDGIAFEAWVAQTRIDPQHLDRPGIDIGIARADGHPALFEGEDT
jgi:hypothetical protein